LQKIETICFYFCTSQKFLKTKKLFYYPGQQKKIGCFNIIDTEGSIGRKRLLLYSHKKKVAFDGIES